MSVVHVHKGALGGPFDLDRRSVDRITAFLFHTGATTSRRRLPENEGKSFIGSYVLGMGFTFDDTDQNGVANPIALMHELIRKIRGTATAFSRTSAAKRSTTARRMPTIGTSSTSVRCQRRSAGGTGQT